MATCKDCLHVEACKFISQRQEKFMNDFFSEQGREISVKFGLPDAEKCPYFKDRSRFVELPFPISEGTKLRYIFEDESGRIRAGEDWETVTRVCKDGFYVSGRLDSDGTYQQGDDFYPWDAIGTEYFFTLEEAEAALKEHKK